MNANPMLWNWSLQIPRKSDPRWMVFTLLGLYNLLGIFVLGFSRTWEQMTIILGAGALLDMFLSGWFKGTVRFPLSALISCLSLAILLNFSLGFQFLWLPVLITIASKYIIRINGKHVFNPSLFGICVVIWLGDEMVSLSPAYQWFGNAETAWAMGVFIVTASLLLFIRRVQRHWLVLSFLFFYFIQTALRAYILREHIPAETLFIGSITSPAFYLFTFYMITDPATSPKGKRAQIITGFFLAALDLYYHTKFSLYTFFFAGFTVGSARYAFALFNQLRLEGVNTLLKIPQVGQRLMLGVAVSIMLVAFGPGSELNESYGKSALRFQHVPSATSGLGYAKSEILNETDPRVSHIAKWMLSVGDAVAVSDVNGDGYQDIFLTQILKDKNWQAKLHINKGDMVFEKISIPPLETYLGKPKLHGLPSSCVFFDYDNDGDQDLFVGFSFGRSHLFRNLLRERGVLGFEEVAIPFLKENQTVSVASVPLDFNNDGYLDLLVTNILPPYLQDYEKKVVFNIFNLPQPAYEGDRRMFHFMHESWHNANNGGKNHLLINEGGHGFSVLDEKTSGLSETRWSLAVGTMDINGDGFTDIYIANDFGRDDCYLNNKGERFIRQEGYFFGDVGKDTYKGMNVSIGDIDGNGKEDIHVSNVHHAIQAEGSLLWMNITDSLARSVDLKERASQRNLLNPNRFGWGAVFGDFDRDGSLDLIQANGMVGDTWDKRFEERDDYWYYQMQIARAGPEIHSYADKWADIRGRCIYENEPDRVMINNGSGDFMDIADDCGIDHRANTRGVASADFDNDGDLDVLITDQFNAPWFYENTSTTAKWVGFNLMCIPETSESVRPTIGDKVEIRYQKNDGNTGHQFRVVRSMTGFSAQSDSRVLFGLKGIAANLVEVKVTSSSLQWSSGWNTYEVNQYHCLENRSDQLAQKQSFK